MRARAHRARKRISPSLAVIFHACSNYYSDAVAVSDSMCYGCVLRLALLYDVSCRVLETLEIPPPRYHRYLDAIKYPIMFREMNFSDCFPPRKLSLSLSPFFISVLYARTQRKIVDTCASFATRISERSLYMYVYIRLCNARVRFSPMPMLRRHALSVTQFFFSIPTRLRAARDSRRDIRRLFYGTETNDSHALSKRACA